MKPSANSVEASGPATGRRAPAAWAALVIAVSLFIGVAGYHYFEHLPWIDALLNASMILGGMGPVNPLHNDAAKVFASIYALFSGFLILASFAVLVAPWVHLMLHRLHADIEEDET